MSVQAIQTGTPTTRAAPSNVPSRKTMPTSMPSKVSETLLRNRQGFIEYRWVSSPSFIATLRCSTDVAPVFEAHVGIDLDAGALTIKTIGAVLSRSRDPIALAARDVIEIGLEARA